MKPTQFKFFNRTINKLDTQNVVVYQNPWKDTGDTQRKILAWKVIKKCGPYMYCPFEYAHEMSVIIKDQHRNHTQPWIAQSSTQVNIKDVNENIVLQEDASATVSDSNIAVSNKSDQTVDVYFYRGDAPFAAYLGLKPAQTLTIGIPNKLKVGINTEINAKSALSPTDMPQNSASISTINIASTDLCLAGGGTSVDAKAYSFIFENILYA